MLTSESKRKLTAGAMFGLPVGIVLIAANVMAPPPAASNASGPAVAPPIPPIGINSNNVVSPEARAALAHIDDLQAGEFGRSPLYHPERTETPVQTTDPRDPAPVFKIQLIMAASSGNIVLIGGKKYRIGDTLDDIGWVVIDIDAVARSVSIKDPDTGMVRRQTVAGGAGGNTSVIVRPPVSGGSNAPDSED
ncbi:MAG: hypothetical protein ACYTGP_00490 [Planctomycetota bacterium]|jgi:hypothetical protein